MRADHVRAETRTRPATAATTAAVPPCPSPRRAPTLRSRTPAPSRGTSAPTPPQHHHRRRPLQPRRRVHHITRDKGLPELRPSPERHHRLARIDTDPHLQRKSRTVLVQLADRLQDPQASPHRSLGVVLVRHRRPEHRHHRIPDELLHRPTVPLQHPPHLLVVRPQPRPHVLGIRLLRRSREADQVAEQHRHDFPLLQRRRRRGLRKRRRAETTELEALRVLFAAGRAGRHQPSLKTATPKRRQQVAVELRTLISLQLLGLQAAPHFCVRSVLMVERLADELRQICSGGETRRTTRRFLMVEPDLDYPNRGRGSYLTLWLVRFSL